MVISTVQINVNFNKWAEAIRSEVETYTESYHKQKKNENIVKWIATVICLLAFIVTSLFCNDRENHTILYHSLYSAIAAAVILVFYFLFFDSASLNKNILSCLGGYELDTVLEYFKDCSSESDSYSILSNMPFICSIIKNWNYVQLLKSGDYSIWMESSCKLSVILHNKKTKECFSMPIEHIYADHNALQDKNTRWVLVITEDSATVYEEEIFNSEVDIKMICPEE